MTQVKPWFGDWAGERYLALRGSYPRSASLISPGWTRLVIKGYLAGYRTPAHPDKGWQRGARKEGETELVMCSGDLQRVVDVFSLPVAVVVSCEVAHIIPKEPVIVVVCSVVPVCRGHEAESLVE